MTGARPGLRLIRWRNHRSGTLVGYADIAVPISLNGDAIILYNCTAYRRTDGKKWVGLINRPRVKNGQQQIGADGKPAYDAVIEFSSRSLSDRFSDAAVALIEARHPHAFDADDRGEDVR